MNLEILRDYCLLKPHVTEEFPFDNETLVFKVAGKAFLLTGTNDETLSFNVKCNPEYAIELREKYPFVTPGYHMNKKHWNTILAEKNVPDKLLLQWIDDSYRLVIEGVPEKRRKSLGLLDE